MSELTLSTRENSLQTKSPLNPATPPKNGACLLWALPKELSDEILRLAYGTPDKPMSMLDEPAFECMQKEKPFEVSSRIPSTTSHPPLQRSKPPSPLVIANQPTN
jgi:hypothetical protein